MIQKKVTFSDTPACVTFPRFDSYKNKHIGWSLLPAEDGFRCRQVAIAEVSKNEAYCYALEIERTSQKISVLIMARQDLGQVGAKEWLSFLLDCARKGRWMSKHEMVEYLRRTTSHQGFISPFKRGFDMELSKYLRTFVFFIILLLSCGPGAAYARNCTASEKETADKLLRLNKRDQAAAVQKHLPWGSAQPTAPSRQEKLLVQRDYVNNYDHDLLVPVWTAHRLDAKDLERVSRVLFEAIGAHEQQIRAHITVSPRRRLAIAEPARSLPSGVRGARGTPDRQCH